MRYLREAINKAVDEANLDGLVDELTDLLWETANLPQESGGLPTVGELGYMNDWTLVITNKHELKQTILKAIDFAL